MQILVVEDEPVLARKITKLIGEIMPEAFVHPIISSVEATVEWFDAHPQPDVVFMDLQLIDGLCFEIFEKSNVSASVVFTAPAEEYTLKTFSLNRIDHLVKPVRKSDLELALAKVIKLSGKMHFADFNHIGEQFKPHNRNYQNKLFLNSYNNVQSIDIENITAIYELKKNCYCQLVTGEHFMLDNHIETLEMMLNPSIFFRINKNIIVNVMHVSKARKAKDKRIKLKLNPELPITAIVSHEKSPVFEKWYLDFNTYNT